MRCGSAVFPSETRGANPLITSRRILAAALAAAAALADCAIDAQPPSGDHGTPPGWKFAWPAGDPARGREIFVKLECYSCHEVKGDRFPAPQDGAPVGPELSVMGSLHEPEYFAEAIINPNAVIERGKGYEAPDGSSKMPYFNDAVTVQEVVDLVAYLRSLRPPAGGPATGEQGPHRH
jgi:mono/diheme cytochrome c family protein